MSVGYGLTHLALNHELVDLTMVKGRIRLNLGFCVP